MRTINPQRYKMLTNPRDLININSNSEQKKRDTSLKGTQNEKYTDFSLEIIQVKDSRMTNEMLKE
jgi:hypothetical protein